MRDHEWSHYKERVGKAGHNPQLWSGQALKGRTTTTGEVGLGGRDPRLRSGQALYRAT